eukprot:SAG31_NODE_128_length_23532_cov_21.204754_15_plen_668_part_00
MPAYWLDTTLVTQGEFANYLQTNPSALPRDRYHYLKNWHHGDRQQPPKPYGGNESLPVTFVGLAEARAYCKAVGKRLPREEEWQFAATGGGDDIRPYPWGFAEPVPGKHIPIQHTGNVFPGPEHVKKYPAGASPFGVQDMTGSVWQMTDEYRDNHTRSVILRGGSNYRPKSSIWYFPQLATNCDKGACGVTTLQLHNKYFLMNSRYERAGTVGFRCAADVPGSDSPPQCGGKLVCGGFQAPTPHVELTASDEWVVWDGGKLARSPMGKRISMAVSGAPGAALAACNGTQTTFSWTDALRHQYDSSAGTCLLGHNGKRGIVFNVSTGATAPARLTVWAGSTAGAAMVTATLIDGATLLDVFTEHVNTTAKDLNKKASTNLQWELRWTPKSASSVLVVNVSSPLLPLPAPPPAPPPPTPAPCSKALCGTVVKHIGDVNLSATGVSDWAHYGLDSSSTSVNRKCAVASLIAPLSPSASVAGFNNCPQTFTWSRGGFETGTPVEAQVRSATQTPSGVYIGVKGGRFNFSVEVPEVRVTTTVFVYVGSCSNQGVLQTELLNPSGAVMATYDYTMNAADGKACQWTGIATLTVPAAEAPGKRTLRGIWSQAPVDSKATNIQFHAIAVDAGAGFHGDGGAQVACARKSGGAKTGSVILQAALLATRKRESPGEL